MLSKRKTKESASASTDIQTDVELDLKKLKRLDLLELLYDQVRENEESSAAIAKLTEENEHLRRRLDETNELVMRLAKSLNEREDLIAELQERCDLYSRAIGAPNAHELAEFLAKSLSEYLSTTVDRS